MVGSPTHRQRVAPGPKPGDIDEEQGPDDISMDGPVEWVDKATFPDQIMRGPEGTYWKFDHIEVKIFDMSKEEDRKDYSALMSEVNTMGASKSVSNVERKFSDDIHNWRIFVEINHIKYRKLLKTEKKA